MKTSATCLISAVGLLRSGALAQDASEAVETLRASRCLRMPSGCNA
jgi:hypothetical protein